MENTPDFIGALDHYLAPASYFFAGLAVLILLYHELRLFQIKDYKAKYDYVNLHEITYFWYAVLALIIAGTLYLNSIASTTKPIENPVTWFWVRTFITCSFVVIAYFIFYSLVRIYYPRYVEKRLVKLRNKPRLSSTGNLMRKLTEAEEEAHLESAQWSEQKEIHSVDYDVWLDDVTGEKKIEKYISYQHAIECPECGYVTFKIKREELAEEPDESSSGILVKHYACTYCNHREAREVIVAALSENIA